jgi:Secretion system C-terminal sorting domain
MKFIYLTFVAALLSTSNGIQAQFMKMSAKAGGLPNSTIITLRTASGTFNGKLGELGFVIMVPKESPPGTPIPAPTIAVKTTCATCLNTTFPPANWVQTTDFTSDPGFYLYKLGCVNPNIATSPALSINNVADQDAVAIEFTGSTANPTQIRLAHIADGGPGTQYGLSIVDGLSNDLINYIQMFFGSSVIPAAPHPDESTGYSNTQYVPLASIILPLPLMSFTAIKEGSNGILNWILNTQNASLSHFDVERSFTGSDFVKIGRKEAIPGGGSGTYEFNDGGVFNNYSGAVYYRIKQLDRNGDVAYSAIRTIRADSKGFGLNLYPNPVVKEANLSFSLTAAKQVSLIISDAAGKVYTDITMQAQKGINQKTIDMSFLAAGTYMFRVVAGDESQTLSFVKSK